MGHAQALLGALHAIVSAESAPTYVAFTACSSLSTVCTGLEEAPSRPMGSAYGAFLPHLASRRRVRSALKRAMVQRQSLKALWEGGESEGGRRVQDEEIFSDGQTVRERNSGRLDVELPWRGPPFGSDGFAHNPFARSVLSGLLGPSHRLHSTHAVVSLGGLEAEEQHWHRDNDLLFEGDQQGRGAVGEGQGDGNGASAEAGAAVPPWRLVWRLGL